MSETGLASGWEADETVRFSDEHLRGISLPSEAREFLGPIGLPREAAPFLSFKCPDAGPLCRASDTYHLAKSYSVYCEIGVDGIGNPICLVEGAGVGRIVSLDHENRFAEIIVNSSVQQLHKSLLAFRRCVSMTQQLNGQDAWLEGKIPHELISDLEETIRTIDPDALVDGAFWPGEIQDIQAYSQSQRGPELTEPSRPKSWWQKWLG